VKRGGLTIELEHAAELRRGRLLGLSMAREEGSVTAMARQRAMRMVAAVPALLGWRWKKPAGLVRPKRPSGPVRPAGPKARSE
jgi:hypothetical protein